jgi:DNA-binding response OmpR family regulator
LDDTIAQILARLDMIEVRLGITHARSAHPFVLDDLHRTIVCPNGKTAKLNPLEYALVRCLLDDPHQAVPFRVLRRVLWNTEWMETSNITVLVYMLRRKIETDPAHPRYIVSKKGVGYAITWEDDGI